MAPTANSTPSGLVAGNGVIYFDESHKNQTGQTRPADESDHGIGHGSRP
jgi:hypothetical protein